MKKYYNTHIHLFHELCAPFGFYGRPLFPFVEKIVYFQKIRRGLIWILEHVNIFNTFDKANKLAAMLNIAGHETQEDIFLNLASNYQDFPEMRFCALSIDFDYMSAGEPLMNYPTQLYELSVLAYKYPKQILPFVCIDPRRKQGQDLRAFAKYYIQEKGFVGFKMYPALGYFPFDPALYEFYDYAEKNRIPIITHCDRGGLYYQGETTSQHLRPRHLKDHPLEIYTRQKFIDDNEKRLERIDGYPAPTRMRDITHQQGENKRIDLYLKSFKDEEMPRFKDNFTDPAAFREVLKIFPKLKLCFAHLGGAEEITKANNNKQSWSTEILKLIRTYPNVYADISYTLHDKNTHRFLFDAIKKKEDPKEDTSKKILFGTDYFLVAREENETTLVRTFIDELNSCGGDLFDQIASINPQQFLFDGKDSDDRDSESPTRKTSPVKPVSPIDVEVVSESIKAQVKLVLGSIKSLSQSE
ncbi:MAG: amidohydrolase family protein [Bacteroidota bacterium]